MSYVEFHDVTKCYHVGQVDIHALSGVSFTVEKGEFVVIVGPSGAGKTTLLNILGGMDACDSGTILLDGKEVSGYSQKELTTYRRYDVGFVFQFYNLVNNLTDVYKRQYHSRPVLKTKSAAILPALFLISPSVSFPTGPPGRRLFQSARCRPLPPPVRISARPAG